MGAGRDRHRGRREQGRGDDQRQARPGGDGLAHLQPDGRGSDGPVRRAVGRTGRERATAAVMSKILQKECGQAAVSEKKTSSRPRCSGRRSVSTWPPAAATAPTSVGEAPARRARRRRRARPRSRGPAGPRPARPGSAARTETPSEPSSDATGPSATIRPAADHQQPVDGVLDLAEQVRGQQHRAAAGRVAAEQPAHPADALRVQPVGRLVEHQHRRVGQQRAGDAQPLPHAERVAADPPSARRRRARPAPAPRPPATPGRRSRRRAAAGASGPVRPGVHGAGVQQRAHDRARVGQRRVGPAVHQRRTGGRRHQAGDHPHRRRLAGAVRAEEAGHRAGLQGERHVVDDGPPAVLLGQSADRDHLKPPAGRPVSTTNLPGTAGHRVGRRARPRVTGRRSPSSES